MKINGEKNTLYQIGSLEHFAKGNYDGLVPSSLLKEYGDTGIGTFHAANGEMIVLEGTVYQAASNGKVNVVEKMTTPLADIKFFNGDISTEFSDIAGIDDLMQKLMEIVSAKGTGLFYIAEISGFFSTIQVRSAYVQTKPYKPLDILLENDEVLFSYENISGTAVGLYCPESAGGLNSPGWHFHFISDDRTKGGHLLDLSCRSAKVKIDICNNFEIITK